MRLTSPFAFWIDHAVMPAKCQPRGEACQMNEHGFFSSTQPHLCVGYDRQDKDNNVITYICTVEYMYMYHLDPWCVSVCGSFM